MNEIKCNIIKDLLPMYVDGIVSDETSADIQAHLDGCSDCRNIYAALKRDLVLPSNPAVQAENGRLLRDFRRKWNMKKAAIACISVLLTVLVLLTGNMVYENVRVVHDFFNPAAIVVLNDLHTNSAWQRINIDGAETLTFDSIFFERQVTLDGNSDSSIALRILDENGALMLESKLQPGHSLNLDMLQRGTAYTVEVNADARFALLRFH